MPSEEHIKEVHQAMKEAAEKTGGKVILPEELDEWYAWIRSPEMRAWRAEYKKKKAAEQDN